MDFLKKVISSVSTAGLAPNFPYILDDLISNETELQVTSGIWSVHRAHNCAYKKSDPLGQVTVFIADIAKNPSIAAAARNALKMLKILRHPRVLKILDGVEVDGKILIATEFVTPFIHKQSEVSKSTDQLLWIIFGLIDALKFINEDAKMIHGNIRKSSLFVTKAGEIRLFGFELISSINGSHGLITESQKYIRGTNSQAWPPEIRHSKWAVLRSNPIHSIDSWMLGALISELLDTPHPNLLSFCRSAMSEDPFKRHSSSSLLEPSVAQRCFNNSFISVERLLTKLPGVDVGERDRIFVILQKYLADLTQECIGFNIVLVTISLLDFQQLSLEGIKLILTAAKFLDTEIFKACLEPTIVVLFSKPDRAIRLLLLDHFEEMVNKLSEKAIQDAIFGYFVGGFTDVMPELRERTLKMSVVLAPKVTSRQINNELVRNFARLQADEQPGIRVNAMICLGKISTLIDECSRQKIFVASISRALQDPFPPSRSAALSALSATIVSFSANDLARKFLPLICPLLVDRDLAVKGEAFESARSILDRLGQLGETASNSDQQAKSVQNPEVDSPASKSSEWGSWGLQTIASRINTIQQKYSATSPRQSQVVVQAPSSPEISDTKSHDKIPTFDITGTEVQSEVQLHPGWIAEEDSELEDLIQEAEPENQLRAPLKNLNLNSGWGGDDELDPWSST